MSGVWVSSAWWKSARTTVSARFMIVLDKMILNMKAFTILAGIYIAINIVQVTIAVIVANDRTKKYEEAKQKYKM